MKDIEVTLNNYFRSFSVGYSLFPRSEKDIFRVLHHIDWRKQELQYSTIVSENLFVLKPNNKFKEQLGLRNDINSWETWAIYGLLRRKISAEIA